MFVITSVEHQKAVSQAVVKFLAGRWHKDFEIIGVPDEIEKTVPAVDLWFKDGSGHEYVLEHTVIESFFHQLEDNEVFARVFKPLEQELKEKIPGNYLLQLSVEVERLEQIEECDLARHSLRNWLVRKAGKLSQADDEEEPVIREKPPGFNFHVELQRHPGGNGELIVKALPPADLDSKRRERLDKAFDDKLPKLREARGEERTSILLLELSNDQLSDYGDIGQALKEETVEKGEILPDTIFLAETRVKPWQGYLFKEGEDFYPDVKDRGPHPL